MNVPDRYTFDEDGEIDELVLSNADVHLERVTEEGAYMLIVENSNGRFHLSVQKAWPFAVVIGDLVDPSDSWHASDDGS